METEAQRRASLKYKKAHFKRVSLDMQKTYYNEVLKPAVDKSGETVSGYIKRAIAERIEREKIWREER